MTNHSVRAREDLTAARKELLEREARIRATRREDYGDK